jgi:hypothetical protein
MQSVISFNGFDPDTFDGMGMAHSLLGDSKNARKPVVWHFDENAFYDGFYMTGSAAFPPTSTKTRANLTTDELEGVDKWHVPMYPSKTGQYKRECTAGTVYTFFLVSNHSSCRLSARRSSTQTGRFMLYMAFLVGRNFELTARIT